MIKTFAAVAACAFAASSASAATFTFLPGGGNVLPEESVVYSFNNADDDDLVTGSNFLFLNSSTSQAAMPAGSDGSRFLAVLGGGSATVNFDQPALGFSVDLGSIDSYNTLLLNFVGGGSQAFTGSQLVANPNGDQSTPNTNGRFRFFASGNEQIASVTFSSTENSFELDRLAVAAIPEPATWAMMIGGFGLVGAAARSRKKVLSLA